MRDCCRRAKQSRKPCVHGGRAARWEGPGTQPLPYVDRHTWSYAGMLHS